MNRQKNCIGAGKAVAKRATAAGQKRQIICTWCSRTVGVNFDGRIRSHVAVPGAKGRTDL